MEQDKRPTGNEAESGNFEPDNLSSRYIAAAMELENQSPEGTENDDSVDDAATPPTASDTAAPRAFFDSHSSWNNIDQTVNLMDVKAANYDLHPKDDGADQTRSSSHDTGQGSAFVEALMGSNDDKKASSGWSNSPRPDKPRRQTWDTTFVGRFTVWLVFFVTLFLFTFLIPYLLMDKRNSSQTAIAEVEVDNGKSRADNIKLVIAQSGITSEGTMQDESSDAYYAVRWLSQTDPAQVKPLVNHHDNTELLQRYALAVLYYAAHPTVDPDAHSQGNQDNLIVHVPPHLPWENAASTSSPGTDATATADAPHLTQSAHLESHQREEAVERSNEGTPQLVRVQRDGERIRKLDADVPVAGWVHNNSWMTAANVCDWYGIKCDESGNGVIVHLNLTSNQLKGTIPSEILALSKLKSIDLSRNELSGPIPTNLWKHLPLQYFLVNQNKVSGSIPSDLGHMTTLEELDFSNNTVTGTIPSVITNLRHLRVLRLEDNRMSGSIPPMAELSSLSVLRLGGNKLAGNIPIHIFQLKKLVDLGLQRSSLTGTFPPEIDSLHSLQRLDLSGNRISGPLPEVFIRLQDLNSLDLGNNQLTDKLPTSLGLLGKLEHLMLSFNQFEGSIPDQWSGMSSLVSLALDHNSITGTIPSRMLHKTKSLQELQLQNNKMTGTVPVEFGTLTGLKTVKLASNSFKGWVPLQLGSIPALETLTLTETGLTGTIPVEICVRKGSGKPLNVTADCSKVHCVCCDNCGAPSA